MEIFDQCVNFYSIFYFFIDSTCKSSYSHFTEISTLHHIGLFTLASFGKVLILLQYYISVVSVNHALSLCGKAHYHTLTLKFSLKILYYSFFFFTFSTWIYAPLEFGCVCCVFGMCINMYICVYVQGHVYMCGVCV